jgi:hypothetical protein
MLAQQSDVGRQSKRMGVESPKGQDQDNIIETIPQELFEFILSFIQPKFPNLLRLTLVNKYWFSVISEPSGIWRGDHVYDCYKYNKMSSDTIIKYLSRCPANALTSFRLLGATFAPPDNVNIDDPKIPPQLRHFIDTLTTRASGMIELELGEMSFYAVPKEAVIRLAQNCRSLTKVTFSVSFGCPEKKDTADKYGWGYDFLVNLPPTLPGVTVVFASRQTEGKWPRWKTATPHPGIGKLVIEEDCGLEEKELTRLFRLFPSLEQYEAHAYWGGRPLPKASESDSYPNIKCLGLCSRDLPHSDYLIAASKLFPYLTALKLYNCYPNWADLAMLSQLESLTIDTDVYRDDEGPTEVDMMFYSLCNLREMTLPRTLFPSNISKYILTKCSPRLECVRVFSPIPLELKHIAHLLDGTYDDQDEDNGGDGDDENNEEGEEEEGEEEDDEWSHSERENQRKRKALYKALKEEMKNTKRATTNSIDRRRREQGVGLKRIEIAFMADLTEVLDQENLDPQLLGIDKTQWEEWYEGAVKLVAERTPAVRFVNVIPYMDACFVKE